MVTSLRPSGKVASTWTSGSISATPSITWSRVSTSRPLDHQVGDPAPVPGPLDHPGGQQRHRLRVVQLDAASQPVPGHHAGHGQQQLLGVGGGQMHLCLLVGALLLRPFRWSVRTLCRGTPQSSPAHRSGQIVQQPCVRRVSATGQLPLTAPRCAQGSSRRPGPSGSRRTGPCAQVVQQVPGVGEQFPPAGVVGPGVGQGLGGLVEDADDHRRRDLPAGVQHHPVPPPLPDLAARDLRGGSVFHQVVDADRAAAGQPVDRVLQRDLDVVPQTLPR